MASGYTRQSAANIGVGLPIQSADLNNEYNQIQAAFDGTSGHTHTGGSGLGAKIPLTTSVSGTLPLGNGGTGGTTFTAGSVLFSNGTRIQQDNTNFFWDDTNNYLGIGVAAPQGRLHLHTTGATSTRMQLTNGTTGATNTDGLLLQTDTTGNGYVWNYENQALVLGTNNLTRVFVNAGGNVSIGNTNDTYKLDVTGDMNISGTYRKAGTALAASHLSNGTTGTGVVMLATNPFSTGTLNAVGITMTGNLSVGGSGGVTGTFAVAGATSLFSTLAVSSNATVGGTLGVTGVFGVNGAASFLSTVAVTSNTTVGGTLGVTGATTLSSTLAVVSNATVGGTLGVTGAASLAQTLTVVGATATGNLSVTGSISATGNFSANAINSLSTPLALSLGGTGATTQAAAFAATSVVASSLADPGYIKLPNGLILQWGTVSCGLTAALVFPIAFPASVFSIQVTPSDNVGFGYYDTLTVNGCTIGRSASVGAVTVAWFAVGI